MQSVDIDLLNIDQKIKTTVSAEQAWHYRIVPFLQNEGCLHLLAGNKRELADLKGELEIVLGQAVILRQEEGEKLEKLLLKHYPKLSGDSSQSSNGVKAARLNVNDYHVVETIVKEAKGLGSSDIHIEIYSEKCRIRYRIDGVLIDRHTIQKQEYPTLINKLKIAASCDIGEKRLPQDGRIRLKLGDSAVDIRVSVLPTLYGEKVVLRLLGNDSGHLDIKKLGFSEEERERYTTAVKKPNGIILISGPTGSGKTTTLYATLKEINKPTNNVITIEDPIEYTLDGINQVQLKEDIGLNYSEALRTFLRQDPDIIMLGEIRDAQTAQMAVRAALTGHLVLSTIHTNSAWGTISRLVDMGVAPYLLASVLNLSVAQRLIRVLCNSCKEEQALSIDLLPEEYRKLKIEKHFVSKGCRECYFTGFKGRKAIYEVIDITKELIELIKNSETNIDDYLRKAKIKKLAENALFLFVSGETSIEEVYPYLISDAG